MFLVVSVLVPLAQALPVHHSDTSGRATRRLRAGSQSDRLGSQAFSLLSVDQVPGPTPQYVKYGKPEFTTFENASLACQACLEFFPEKEDGKRFHSKLYEDKKSGGTWDRVCRAGTCDFRDPQTEPVGGVLGKTGNVRTCITRDPVQWFEDCEPILLESTQTLLDATRYCSYREQMYIPPPIGTVSRFDGEPKAWDRIGGTHEKCLATIEREGAHLWDDMNFCDVDMPALSGCCETVYSSITCVAETATAKGANQTGIFTSFDGEFARMIESFSKYCVPLCQNNKEEFCDKWPEADVCVKPEGCAQCTSKGGLWCPKLKSCHCPSKKPPCIAPPITVPLNCVKPDDDKGKAAAAKVSGAKPDDDAEKADDAGKALCKYTEMARKWKPRD